MGTWVQAEFADKPGGPLRWHTGKVVRVRPPQADDACRDDYYRINFSDGDVLDYDPEELAEARIPDHAVPRAHDRFGIEALSGLVSRVRKPESMD